MAIQPDLIALWTLPATFIVRPRLGDPAHGDWGHPRGAAPRAL